jgi:hypothetical protein
MLEEESDLLNLASEDKNIKQKLAAILFKLENEGITETEDQVITLLKNMMNFFAQKLEEIPSFDSLSPEQQKALLLKFKDVSRKLSTRKIRSVDEMLQIFVFTILNNIGIQKIDSAKLNPSFQSLIRKAASYEIYYEKPETQVTEELTKNNVLLEAKKAIKKIELKEHSSDKNLNPKSIKTSQRTHGY